MLQEVDVALDATVVEIGGTAFYLLETQVETLDEVERSGRTNLGGVLRAYAAYSGDERNNVSRRRAIRVVQGAVQEAWYKSRGLPIPPKVIANQDVRLQEALMATKEADEETTKKGKSMEPKEKRVTAKDIITNGLLKGTPDEEILAEVKEALPNQKTDMRHIDYYRHFLTKEGKLEKRPRRTRTKKAEENGAEEDAEVEAKPKATKKSGKQKARDKAASRG